MSYCLRVVVNNVPDAHSLLLYGAEFISCYPFACNGWVLVP